MTQEANYGREFQYRYLIDGNVVDEATHDADVVAGMYARQIVRPRRPDWLGRDVLIQRWNEATGEWLDVDRVPPDTDQ